MYQKVAISILENVGFLTIKNPPANALSVPVVTEIIKGLEELVGDEKVRVIVLTGEGEKFFVAGADIKEFSDKTITEGRMHVRLLQGMLHRFERVSKPIIAAINGYCLGGGLELALACDIRYAADTAKLGQPEINLGIIPGAGGTQRLPRLIGKGKAKEMIYTGAHISASEALQIQLVQKVFPLKDLLSEVTKLAKEIAKKSPLIISYAKEAIDFGTDVPIEQGLLIEADSFALCFGTKDKDEGVKAFLEKREPKFIGK
ncbi:MAG TPA: enoyl-CoA hydratase-related protein [Candidatus Hodarchaeales archaeon]|nr:enoyl-CoA hydratase-related protein [Candidatus Hodarchaeales archaeon]